MLAKQFVLVALLFLSACAVNVPTPVAINAGAEPTPPYSSEWRTDFSKHSVPREQIRPGGPPKGGIGVDEGIAALMNPKFITATQETLPANEPVIVFSQNDDARAYPLRYLIWHEIVNDNVGGIPIAITYCPLCNSAIVFERRVDGTPTPFGTTGHLRYSDLVMYDALTESWWQQLTGEAIMGERTGDKLKQLPSQVLAWGDFKREFPNAPVMARPMEMVRRYGFNPYVGYDTDETVFSNAGSPAPNALKPLERVIILQNKNRARVYPYTILVERRVVNEGLNEQPAVIFWKPGVASALERTQLELGRDVGAVGTFDPRVDDKLLTFEWRGENFVDKETGSVWSITGAAIDGALKGKQLTPLLRTDTFWFAWAAFQPDSEIFGK